MRISDWSSDVCSSDLESRQTLRKGWTNPVRAVIKRRFGGWARTAHVGEGPMAAWRSLVLTIFPEMFPGPLGLSLAGKALERGLWALDVLDIRDFARDKHRSEIGSTRLNSRH